MRHEKSKHAFTVYAEIETQSKTAGTMDQKTR
jgi:hypothetical protein